MTLGFGTQVYGRFSLGDRKSALISNDWVVGLNTTAVLGAWRLTGEVYHESSHLGDEYGDRFGASRLDWTREVVAAWLTYGTGPLRVTGNLSYVLDRRAGSRPPRRGAGGSTGEGRPFGSFLGGRCGRSAVSSSKATAATSWRVSSSAKLGVASRGRSRGGKWGSR